MRFGLPSLCVAQSTCPHEHVSGGRSARLTLTLTWIPPRLPQLLLDPPGLCPGWGPLLSFSLLDRRPTGRWPEFVFPVDVDTMASLGQLGQHCGTTDFPPGAKSSTYHTAQKSTRHSRIMFFLQHRAQAGRENIYTCRGTELSMRWSYLVPWDPPLGGPGGRGWPVCLHPRMSGK